MKTPDHRKVGWLQRYNSQASFLASIYVYVCQHTHTHTHPSGPSDVPGRILTFLFSQIISASSGLALFREKLYISGWMYKFPTRSTLSKRFPTIGPRRIKIIRDQTTWGECVDGCVHLSDNFSSLGKGKCQVALSDFLVCCKNICPASVL